MYPSVKYSNRHIFKVVFTVRPWPRPEPSRGLGLPWLTARAPISESLSPQKPGPSRGFQAEPSPHITTLDIDCKYVTKKRKSPGDELNSPGKDSECAEERGSETSLFRALCLCQRGFRSLLLTRSERSFMSVLVGQ